MASQIIFSINAEKEILKLSKSLSKRIIEKIDEFALDIPPTKRASKLNNHRNAQYRYRIGDYRVLFDYDEDQNRVEILKIAHRSFVYD
jgi:mRNA interferase RelE/StbE